METFSFQLHSSIRGFHIYQAIWTLVYREVLKCVRESRNRSDRFAVAVQKGETVVGHVPRDYSCICSLFLGRGGSIASTVTGPRHYSHDLEKGGLEIPCIYTFSCKGKNSEFMDKTKRRLEELKAVTTEIVANTNEDAQGEQPATDDGADKDNDDTIDLMPQASEDVPKEDHDVTWVTIRDIKLTQADKRVILSGEKLMDQHINSAQRLICAQFPTLNGLGLSLL